MRVAVVGGGLAGLSAALELVDGGHEVTLHEARPTLGGAVQTLPRREGDPEPPPDNGQHVALGCFSEYLRFLDRVGQSGSVRRVPLELPVLDEHGRSASISPSALALLRYRHVSLRRAAADPAGAHALGRRARRDLRRRAAGARPVAAGDRPLLGRLHPAGAEPAQRGGERGGRRLHRPHRAARRAQRLRPAAAGAAARGDARRRRRPRARGRRRDGAHRTRASRASTSSTRTRSSSRCRRARARSCSASRSRELEDSPIVSVHLWFDRVLLGSPLAALLGSDAHWVFDRGALTGSPPERGQYLTVVSSGAPELMELRGRELVERIAAELTGRLGPAELLWSRVSREPAATIAVRPGSERTGPARGRAGRTSRARARGPRQAGRRRWKARSVAASPPRAPSRRRRRRWRRERRHRDAPRRRDRGRDRAPARAPAPRRLLGRRARVERDHDRAAPLLAPRPRPAHARARPQDRQRAARAPARRRHLGDLVRRPGRPLDDRRGLRGARSSPASTPARRRATSSARAAGSRRRGSSPSASSPCSASGRGSG